MNLINELLIIGIILGFFGLVDSQSRISSCKTVYFYSYNMLHGV